MIVVLVLVPRISGEPAKSGRWMTQEPTDSLGNI